MKNHIQQILSSELILWVVDGRLSVKGDSDLVAGFRPMLKEYRDEIIRRLQADSATETGAGMFAPAITAVATANLQCSENEKLF